MNTKFKIVIITATILVGCLKYGYSQVGIGTTTPKPTAMLEIESADKGLLIPRMNKSSREQIALPDTSLLVYDLTLEKFMYYNGTKWLTLTPWDSEGDLNSDITTATSGNIGIGDAPIAGAGKLQVFGNTKVTGNITATANVTANNITSTNNIETTTGEFIGNGTIPLGGIIMWSGDLITIPVGWALCNGQTINSYKTPDLRGRFIVGYGENNNDNGSGSVPASIWDGNYTEPGNLSDLGVIQGNKNGEKVHVLTAAESGLPAHDHPATTTGTTATDGAHKHSVYKGNGTSGGGFDVGENDNTGWYGTNSGSHFHSLSATTVISDNVALPASSAHENRPPYYVLAFIIRVE